MPEMKRIGQVLVGIYLLVGFVYAMWAYSQDLRTFVCEAPDAPHGYVTVWTNAYENPEPNTCIRRGFSSGSVLSIPFMTLVGVPLLIVRGVPREWLGLAPGSHLWTRP